MKTHLVRQHGENYADNKESVYTNVSIDTASTSKNMQDNFMAFKDFFQRQLSHNLARSKVIMASVARFIAKDLRPYSVIESDGFRDVVIR